MQSTTVLVDRVDLTQCAIQTGSIDADDLHNGQVLLRVDRFALTANNITYAVKGEELGYWQFFPVANGKGVIPVWGFADVVASRCSGVAVGERFYGYYPLSTHLVVKPAKLKSDSFFDGEEHRLTLPPIYNQYLRCTTDPLYRIDTESVQMLLRPLFTTSFLLEDFFRDNDYFGAESIVVTSASSKTAIAAAFMLQRQRAQDRSITVIGLTSPANLAFTQGLGCYDRVLSYDQAEQLPTDKATVITDFAGSAQLLGGLHALLVPNLKYSCTVGFSHWQDNGSLSSAMLGPEPIMFFAPTQAAKRWSEWGKELFGLKLAEAWTLFTDFANGWLKLETGLGPEAVVEKYQQVLRGQVAPKTGIVLSLNT